MSGGAQQSSSKGQQQSQSFTPEQSKWMGKALEIYGPQLGQGENIYEGLRTAPLTDLQTNVLASGQGVLDTLNNPTQTPLYNETGTALKDIISGTAGAQPMTSEQTNKYFTEAVQNPYLKNVKDYQLPAINEAYAGPGYWGSARAGAVAKASDTARDWLGTQRAQTEWDVLKNNQALEEAKASRQLSAVPQAMEYGNYPASQAATKVSALNSIYGLGSQEQAQRQSELNDAVNKFLEQNRLTSQEDIAILLSLLGMSYSTSSGMQKSSSSGWQAGI